MDILHGLVTGNVWVWTGLISVVVVLLVAVVLLGLVWAQLNRECDLRGFEGLDYEIDGKNENDGFSPSGYRVGDSHCSSFKAGHGQIPASQRQKRGYPRAGRAQSRHPEAL